MTQADFIAACFWPTMIAMTLLVMAARESAGRQLIGYFAFGAGFFYFLLWMFYGDYSLVAILDLYVLFLVLGPLALWTGVRALIGKPTYLPSRKATYLSILFGASMVGIGGYSLFGDFAMRPLELEGRVERVWVQGSRARTRYVRIASQNVKAIIPDFERLELLPVVRVKVGRGSNYIYKIEYLAN